jgi:putative transcriptional regulator
VKTRLKVLRAERDWTQQDLADRLDVSRQAVNALETDKHSPSLDLAYKIAALFDLTVEEVFENPYRTAAKGKR